MTLPDVTPTLTAADRCDVCQAQAKARATMESGNDLLFCAHHVRVHEPLLIAQGARIDHIADYSGTPGASP